jgi:hypothetical protein
MPEQCFGFGCQRDGHEVIEAGAGVKGMTLFQATVINLILTDRRFSRMDTQDWFDGEYSSI